MKFLFIHSWQGFSLAEWYLRNVIKSHCDSEISFRSVDIPSNGIPANDSLSRIFFSWEPDIVGFSCHFWSLSYYLHEIKWLKKNNPNLLILLGGPQVNSVSMADSILKEHKGVDFIIRGCGETSLPKFLNHHCKDKPYDSIQGLSYRNEKGIVHNRVNQSASYQRDLIFHKGNCLLNDRVNILREISFETISGCHSRCAYCYYGVDNHQILDDERIKSELTYICNSGVRDLRICDTHFGGTKSRAKMLLTHLANVNRQTSVKIYPDITHIDDEYLDLIELAGAHITSIGIQTTNSDSLKLINRKNSLLHSENIKRILKKYPDTPADLIVGLPQDNFEGLKQSFKDCLDLGFSNLNIFQLMIFPGTPLYENIDFYFRKELILSQEGKVISSEYFPSNIQGKLNTLINSVYILCYFLKNKLLDIRSEENPSDHLDYFAGMPGNQLLDIYESISNQAEKINEQTLEKYESFLNSSPRLSEKSTSNNFIST